MRAMIDSMHILTYGTLMFSEVWKIVVGREFRTIEAALDGYAIYRVADAPYPGIVADAGSSVRGLVYLDVDPDALARLDTFEGEFYERLSLPVVCRDGQRRTASAYVVPEHNRYFLTAEPWSAESFVSSGGLTEFIDRYQGFSWLRGEPARGG